MVLLWAVLVGCPIGASWMRDRHVEAEKVSRDFWSRSRFRHIESLLLLYHEEHGAFPPTKYQPEPDGPIHSWRVLLVPYTGASFKKRYAAYDFSQEWGSFHNFEALGDMPEFCFFSLDGGRDTVTDYFAIGDGDEWPSKKPLKSYLVKKGKDRFLLVEDSEQLIFWREPKY